MKKLSVVALSLLLQTAAFAASPFPDGFLGIPWGSSKEVAKAAMLKRGIKFDETHTDKDNLFFYGSEFGGEVARYFLLRFYRNQLAESQITFTPPETDVFDVYIRLHYRTHSSSSNGMT